MPASTWKTIHQHNPVDCLLFFGLISGFFLVVWQTILYLFHITWLYKEGLFAVLLQLLIAQHPHQISPSLSVSAVLVFLITLKHFGVQKAPASPFPKAAM